MGTLRLLKDLWGLILERKKFWMIPLVLFLVFFGLLMALAQNSVLAPFIYTLF